MAEPSYSFYQGAGGKLGEADFNAGLHDAAAYVDWLIGWKAVPEEHEEAYFRAVCSCVDVFHDYGTAPLGGFSIGSFRMNESGGAVSGKQIARDACWEILAPTGLLWAGVR